MQHARLDWTENGQPLSASFGDIYFAREGGMAETEAVFLAHNGLPERWQDKFRFTIAETGFGTGLNLLTTARHFVATTDTQVLRFVSVEKFPLSLADLCRAHEALPPELADWAQALQAVYPPALPGLYRLWLHPRIELWLMLGDAIDSYASLDAALGVNAWYLDGFAPAKNPDMWSDALFAQMARLSAPGASLATFTAASFVRRGLEAAGFVMEKVAGFGRKRDMLRGRLPARPAQVTAVHKPWLPLSRPLPAGAEVAVVGAGIAGATTARQLAEAGFAVTVLEAAEQPATAASGNLAGTLLPVMDRGHGPYAQWYWQAWLAARHWLAQQQDSTLGQLCGGGKWTDVTERMAEWRDWVEGLAAPGWLGVQSAQDFAASTGVQVAAGGIHLPQAGWLAPRRVVAQLLLHPAITLQLASPVRAMTAVDGGWQLHWGTGQKQTFAGVVLATGADTARLLPDWGGFLQRNKGQVSHLPASAWRTPPHAVLSFGGYATPLIDGISCIGATFERDRPLGLNDAGHEHNLALIRKALPDALQPHASAVGGHTAYRVMTADHLPLVGPLVAVDAYQQVVGEGPLYPDQCPPADSSLLPGLWLNVGHGSRGLSSAFLAAELLCAQMSGGVSPVQASLRDALHPARVLFRHLSRQMR